jgi:hypothetical protein
MVEVGNFVEADDVDEGKGALDVEFCAILEAIVLDDDRLEGNDEEVIVAMLCVN